MTVLFVARCSQYSTYPDSKASHNTKTNADLHLILRKPPDLKSYWLPSTITVLSYNFSCFIQNKISCVCGIYKTAPLYRRAHSPNFNLHYSSYHNFPPCTFHTPGKMVAITRFLFLLVPLAVAQDGTRPEVNELLSNLGQVKWEIQELGSTMKTPLVIPTRMRAIADFIKSSTLPADFPKLTGPETEKVQDIITGIEKHLNYAVEKFKDKAPEIDDYTLKFSGAKFTELVGLSERLVDGILGHVPKERQDELKKEFEIITSLFAKGAKLAKEAQDGTGRPSSVHALTLEETEVDEILYEITRTTQHLENAVNSIKDDDKGEDKKNTIDPPFREFENSLNKLADSEDLRHLSERESADRLALFQTVRYFLNESMDALVGKAVVLPGDFKEDLSERLEGLLERGTEIAAVVRFGVTRDKQKELSAEV